MSMPDTVSSEGRAGWSEMQEMIPPCTVLSADLSLMSLSRRLVRQAAAAKAAAVAYICFLWYNLHCQGISQRQIFIFILTVTYPVMLSLMYEGGEKDAHH